jgi:hypothetical protein
VPTTAGSGATLSTAAGGPRPAGRRPPPAPAAELPADLAPLAGTYAAWNPWEPEVRVVPATGGAGLAISFAGDDGEVPLTRLADGGFRLGRDPDSPERVECTTVVEGRPMQAVVSGWPYDRVDP